MASAAAGSLWGQLLLIVVLTLFNAFFAAAEIAVVSLSKSRMESQAQKGDRKAAKLVQLMGNSANFLATIQVGITFAGFFASASAATTLAGRVAPLVGGSVELAVIIVTILLSYISLVFGELYPKQLALQMTERVAKLTVTPITWLSVLLRPFVWLLSASTQLLIKLTPFDFSKDTNAITREEMVSIIESGRKSGAIETDEYEMMEGIISLGSRMAREVMVPRTDAFMVDANQPDAEALDEILDQIYSRIPIYRGDKDHVIGIVHIKNLLKKARQVGFTHVLLEQVMTDPLFVPETITIDDLLTEMRVRQQQMAILLDEYGGVVGLVTIEDLIEEIVGDIDDESDEAVAAYTKLDDTDYLVSGKMPLNDFNLVFKTAIETPDADTLAGFVIAQLGVIPTNYRQETLTLPDGVTLTTGKMEGSRLVNVHLHLPHPVEDASKETSHSGEGSL